MAGRKRSAPGESNRRTTRSGASSQNNPLSSTVTPSSSRRTRSNRKNGGDDATPDIYREMIQESRRASAVAPTQNGEASSERPLKRRRPGERPIPKAAEPKKAPEPDSQDLVTSSTSKLSIKDKTGRNEKPPQIVDDDDDEDDDIEFEDVVIPAPTIQTIIQESDDEDDDQLIFEDVDIDPGGPSTADDDQPMELNLTAQQALMNPRRAVDRRKAITNDEKRRRVELHKAHLLCLIAHVERRNRWCNDPEVQAALRPLLTAKIMKALHPRTDQPQFGQSEALKNGIQQAREMFKLKFSITERGLRRSLWAEDPEQLKEYQLPDDIETTLEKEDFLEAAKSLSGSRDVGAQLFTALLRSAGLDARLVCSLQPLPCVPGGGPAMPKSTKKPNLTKPAQSRSDIYAAAVAKHEESSTPSPLRRLGHPNATAYHIPSLAPPPNPIPPPPPTISKKIKGESSYPIYWTEVLDPAYQKYSPVDALVTCTQWRPRALEPPSTAGPERLLNSMTYVVAFSADASAKDVTRRYVKAYNSKTKRFRIDGPVASRILSTIPGSLPGEKWWRKALKRYNPFRFREPTYLEQIEANELLWLETKEPMPKNVADFKDHPVYALERHLRRHEVLVKDAQYTGTVSAGKGQGLEKIYRRRDVRVARSRDKWYRMGRVVKDGEEPVRILPPKKKKKKRSVWDDDEPEIAGGNGEDGEEEEDDPDRVGLFGDALVVAGGGIALYTEEQTRLYIPPPVGNDGRVPKNVFGNIDLYVESMLPRGGAHVDHPRAAHAAYILGVDYAPALTGWKFSGRKGTAVLSGVVVAKDAEEGVWAVIRGLLDIEAAMEMEKRRKRALRMWGRWIKALRIRERVWGEEGGMEEIELDMDDLGDEDDGVEEGGWGGQQSGGFFVGDFGGFESARKEPNKRGRKKRKQEDEYESGGFVVDDKQSAGQMHGEEDGGGGGFMVGDIDESTGGQLQETNDDGGGGFVAEDDDSGGGGFLVDDAPAVEAQADSGGGGFVVEDEDEEDEDVVVRTRSRPERSKDKGKGKALAVEDDDEDEDINMDDVPSDVSEEFFMDEDDEGGGFLVE